VLLLPLLTGAMVWEYVNPVSMLHRGLIFGFGWAWLVIAAVFLYDLLIVPPRLVRTPLSHGRLLRPDRRQGTGARRRAGRERCDDCMDCFDDLPGAAGHQTGPEGRTRRPWPRHRQHRLHQVRTLHRRLQQDVFGFALGANGRFPQARRW
jgi:hypothetical protein